MQKKAYEVPVLHDYGSLSELTAATGFRGPEDGANKEPMEAIPHHSGPLI